MERDAERGVDWVHLPVIATVARRLLDLVYYLLRKGQDYRAPTPRAAATADQGALSWPCPPIRCPGVISWSGAWNGERGAGQMGQKRHTPEQIIHKLRPAVAHPRHASPGLVGVPCGISNASRNRGVCKGTEYHETDDAGAMGGR
jgi:hypothetical protein